MTDKEKVIEKAYKEIGMTGIDMSYDGDGWMAIRPGQYLGRYHDLDILKMNSNTHYIRPKSLKGIDTNNGWTRVYSIHDHLPESKTGRYYMSVDFVITHDIHDSLFIFECLKVSSSIIHVMPFELPELKPIY